MPNTLENDLVLYLLANSGVQTATGTTNPPIYMGAVPMGMPDSPAIVIRTAHTERYNTAGGPVNLKKRTIQFDSYHEVYSTAVVMCDAVRLAIEAMCGQPYVNLSVVTVYGGEIEEEMDMPQEKGDGGYVLRRTFTACLFFAEP